MTKINKDGYALKKLARQVKREAEKIKASSRRPVPPSSIQQQDTDYDIRPAIQKPQPDRRQIQDSVEHTKRGNQFHAAVPDTGLSGQVSQMGESEGQGDYSAYQLQSRLLRARYR